MIDENKLPSVDNWFYILLVIGVLVNASGLFIPILEPDSALYAEISKRMAMSNDWINLFGDGHDWLDKPHFPFWICALSFKIFGINSFAYKLPAFLFWLAGIRFTYLIAKLLYNTSIAQFAVIIYIFALHVIIANFDVRAEPFLTTCIIGAIYYICMAENSRELKYIFLAAIFSACAMMTKGIFVLVTIGSGHIIYWILKKDWKQFINYKWWLLLILSFVFIFPELYCLYHQFDLHPEKIVFGKTGVSGLKFFFWDSQFGRFFNTGPIKGEGDKFFFLHTTLWAFMPWAMLFYIAVFQFIRRKIPVQKKHWIVFGGAAVTFLLFSLSSFQLPHYIIIIFPQFAIITAAFLYSCSNNSKAVNRIFWLQSVLIAFMFLIVTGILVLANFPNSLICLVIACFASVLALWYFNGKNLKMILIKGAAFSIILCLFLNLFFYPNILKYQSGMYAAQWLQKNEIKSPVIMYKKASYSLEFYTNNKIERADNEDSLRSLLQNPNALIYTPIENIAVLQSHGFKVELLSTFDFFPITRLDMDFLNEKTRAAVLQKFVLAKIKVEG